MNIQVLGLLLSTGACDLRVLLHKRNPFTCRFLRMEILHIKQDFVKKKKTNKKTNPRVNLVSFSHWTAIAL